MRNIIKSLIKALLLGLLLVSTTSSGAEVSKRSINNGQLILEDIPEIPATIVSDLNRYQNVRSAAIAAWSADSQSLYVRTRFGEVTQLHRVSAPGGARYQMTFFDEPIGSVRRRPGHDELNFTMDAGGSEYAQLFSFNPADGESKMLSDGESRNGAMLWDHQGKQLAYQSTRRNGDSNDIWLMDPDKPEATHTVLESPDGTWWGPSDFSRDGSQLLILNYVSAADSRVHLLDLETGKSKLMVGGKDDKSVNIPIAFDADSSGFFFITNRNGEFSQLAWAAQKSPNKVVFISHNIPWNVDDFSISDDGKRAAFTVNADGLNELYLLNPKTLKYKMVADIPVGLIGSLSFSPDSSKLAMTLNTSKTPSDSFVLSLGSDALQSKQLTRWTFSEVGGLNTENFVEPTLVHYPTFDRTSNGKQRMIPAFVYKPEGDGPFPVIISIHGGPEGQARPGFNSSFQLWAEKLGAAVVVPNVRGSAGYGKSYMQLDNGFKREDSVKDIGSLLDWLATQPSLDSDRVAVIGGSYGGYMVLAAAVHYSDRLKAAVDIVGISNFVTFLENTKAYRRDLRRVEYGDERDPKMREFLHHISPLNNVEKMNLPMFIVQGQNDPRVPVTEAEQMVKALRDQGQTVWYMNALNEGHGYRKKENRDIYQQAVVMFFKQHL